VSGHDFSQDYSLDEVSSQADDSDRRELTSADLGVGMSVCIAAISSLSDDDECRIIAMADRKVSSVEFSNEDATIKGEKIGKHWLAMFAGADISPCMPICNAVEAAIKDQPNTAAQMMKTFEGEYQKYLSNLAAAKVLGRWNLTMDKFVEGGRKHFGADNFDRLCAQIESIKLQCQFLVCGFDHQGNPHIFTVKNPGFAQDWDTPGYYAIGNGDFAALSTLGFFQQSIIKTVPETYYNVCAAKFMAEKASEVGEKDFTWEIGPRGFEQVNWGIIPVVRKAWERDGGKPSTPDGIIERIASMRPASISEPPINEPPRRLIAKEASRGKE
jgi:hypothetical protein